MDLYDQVADRYCYAGSAVLINKLGITDLSDLEEAERDITAFMHRAVVYTPPPYSLQTLQAIHRTLFSELYAWSGEIRDVDISKGSTRFCTHMRIEAEARRCFAALAEDRWLEGLDRKAVCAKLAEHYCELNMIHPFREGNGRVQRIMFEQLALHAGFVVNWSSVDPQDWLRANLDGVKVDYRAMEGIFDRILST